MRPISLRALALVLAVAPGALAQTRGANPAPAPIPQAPGVGAGLGVGGAAAAPGLPTSPGLSLPAPLLTKPAVVPGPAPSLVAPATGSLAAGRRLARGRLASGAMETPAKPAAERELRAAAAAAAEPAVSRDASSLNATLDQRYSGSGPAGGAAEGEVLADPGAAAPNPLRPSKPETPLDAARRKLYSLAGGSLDSGRPELSRLGAKALLELIRSKEFAGWVASEKAQGKQVFWLTDLDKTMAAGDIFTFYFAWRAKNGRFTEEQNEALRKFLKGSGVLTARELRQVKSNDGARNAAKVLELWRRAEEGKEGGIALVDFWRKAYWPSQVGMTREEKRAQVEAFAPEYAAKVFPGIREQNEALRAAGLEAVIVSNGDQELARAVAPLLGIDPRNTVGAVLEYGKRGVATGKMHTYELYDGDMAKKPQHGKPLNFLFWVHDQRERWPDINRDKITVAAMVGDSAPADGGAMVLMNPALAYLIVDTPGEPQRRAKFIKFAYRYGGALGRGSFVTLQYEAPASGAMPEERRF